MIDVAGWVLLTPALLLAAKLLDTITDLVTSARRRRRLRRLRSASVVRPGCVVRSSPDRRGERFPRLAAAHTHRRRP